MKFETSAILSLDSFIAMRSKSYSYSHAKEIIQKPKQKGTQHTPHYEVY